MCRCMFFLDPGFIHRSLWGVSDSGFSPDFSLLGGTRPYSENGVYQSGVNITRVTRELIQ